MLILNKKISIKDENLKKFNITYLMFKKRHKKFTTYSFKVEITNLNNETEFEIIENLTSSYKEAKNVFNLLVKFKVTPSSLINVIDDFFHNC